MKNQTQFKNKKMIVLGLGKSGLSVANLLNRLGVDLVVNEGKLIEDSHLKESLMEKGIQVYDGGHPITILDQNFDLMVKSPGIPYSNPMIQEAQRLDLPVVTDIEIVSQLNEGELLAITGTNGKTTCTAWLTDMLNRPPRVGKAYETGNIGVPVSEVVQEVKAEDQMVMEVSSFQLMGTRTFKPHIALMTNIYSAHLDFHKDRAEYVQAKMKITSNQGPEDYFIYNYDQAELRNLAKETKARLMPFSKTARLENGAWIEEEQIMVNGEVVAQVSDISLKGEHNLENALAVVLAAKLSGQTNASIQDSLKEFQGVKHRMQALGQVHGRQVYNDSKATNSLATIQALKGFDDSVVLIAGGVDRGVTFDDLVPYFKDHLKALVVYGETQSLLKEAGEKSGLETIILASDVVDATRKAFEASQPGDIILLSPANASWDQYKSFEERGNYFIDTIGEIAEEADKS